MVHGHRITPFPGRSKGRFALLDNITICGREAYSGTLKLNTEVEPKQVDFVIEKCALERYVGTTSLGIYKIEGDKFTMAGNEPGSEVRPSIFERGGGTRVFTFTKQ